jgi:hypothetical protein
MELVEVKTTLGKTHKVAGTEMGGILRRCLLHLLGKKMQEANAYEEEEFVRLRKFRGGNPGYHVIMTILSYVEPKTFILMQHLNKEIYHNLAPKL